MSDPRDQLPSDQSAPVRIEQAGSRERLRWRREERRNSAFAVLVLIALAAALAWGGWAWFAR